MDLSPIAPADLDPDLAADLAVVHGAGLEDLPLPRHTAASMLMDLTRSDESPSMLWVARDGRAVVGFATLTEPRHEYTDAAFLGGTVTPSHQGRGLGRVLLDAVVGATERPLLRARAFRGTAGADVLPAWGFRRTMTHAVRRLDVADAPGRDALRSRAAGASADYDLVRRLGPTPDADLAEMQVLREAINDAPDAHEFEAYPPERIRDYEQSLVDTQQTQLTIVARHRATGEPAGLTMVAVPELRPEVAAQEDTSVLPPHRGCRLGLRLKLDMLDWLRDEHARVRATDTWNDTTNAPMLEVNRQLGARIVAESSAYRRPR
ncbi:MAG: GNAT family N-acetyltransferase [Nocardioides sp.]